jgi:FixJ family two-component response regulator
MGKVPAMDEASVQPIIHIIDDDESVRRALARLLQAADYQVRTYGSAGEFLIHRSGDGSGCILLDIRMPGPSGLELQKALAKDAEPLPVIFLSAHGNVPITVQAMKAGASDFLTKPVQRDALLNAVRAALARNEEARVAREKVRGWRACLDLLSHREREVLERVVAGNMNKQIAGELGMAERTVKAHRAHIMEKMRVNSVAELVHIADALEVSLDAVR